MAFTQQDRSRLLQVTVLVGREPELEIVEDLLEGVAEGGRGLIVRGEPGIGKSALLAEASARAGCRGMRVLTATGVRSQQLVQSRETDLRLRPNTGRGQHAHPTASRCCDRFWVVPRS